MGDSVFSLVSSATFVIGMDDTFEFFLRDELRCVIASPLQDLSVKSTHMVTRSALQARESGADS